MLHLPKFLYGYLTFHGTRKNPLLSTRYHTCTQVKNTSGLWDFLFLNCLFNLQLPMLRSLLHLFLVLPLVLSKRFVKAIPTLMLFSVLQETYLCISERTQNVHCVSWFLKTSTHPTMLKLLFICTVLFGACYCHGLFRNGSQPFGVATSLRGLCMRLGWCYFMIHRLPDILDLPRTIWKICKQRVTCTQKQANCLSFWETGVVKMNFCQLD
mmetsp:Transcript_20085/g.43234  ORF Transcript_20085/g.43234 Transcript_20085/m.43234 type:complete len:211 (+) Transcript_20085:165-797(+)